MKVLVLPLNGKFTLVVPTSARLLLILWNNFSGVLVFHFYNSSVMPLVYIVSPMVCRDQYFV